MAPNIEQVLSTIVELKDEKAVLILSAVQDIIDRINTLPAPTIYDIADKIYKNIITEKRFTDEEKTAAIAILLESLLDVVTEILKVANEVYSPKNANA